MIESKSNRRSDSLQSGVVACSIVFIAISVFFRIWHLSNIPGLNGDEAEYGADSIDILHGHPILWHTQNGNFKNIFYYAPVLILHALFQPSNVLLRTPALMFGIAAIAVNYLLCRRIFSANTALLTTLVIAILPENIAQSRLGWDPSESVLIDLFIVYGSLAIARSSEKYARLMAGTAAACAMAFMVHPSNLFAALFLPIAIAIRWGSNIVSYFDSGNCVLRRMAAALVLLGTICIAATALHGQFAMAAKMQHAYNRGFVLDYAALFSGRSVYKYVAGFPRPYKRTDAIDIISVLPWLLCAGSAVRALVARSHADRADRALAAGWLVQTAAFAVIAGARNLEPAYDRYGLCLIVPGVWLLIRSLEQLAVNRRLANWLIPSFALAISAALLASFYICYFYHILTTGGTGENTFHAAAIDPKIVAIHYVLDQCPRDQPCYVICSNWWNYQPTRYYAMSHPSVRVIRLESPDPKDVASCLQGMRSGTVWTISFISDRWIVHKTLAIPGITWTIIAVSDYGGNPIVIVGHPVLPSVDPGTVQTGALRSR